MRGLDPRIHRKKHFIQGWIAGSSPAMTVDGALSTAADRAHPSNSGSLPAASAVAPPHPKRAHRSRAAFLSLAGSVAGASSSASRKPTLLTPPVPPPVATTA